MFFYGSIHTWAWCKCDYYSPFELEIMFKTKKKFEKDQWDWYYLGRHNGFCSVGLTVLIPQKLRVYDQFNASYT